MQTTRRTPIPPRHRKLTASRALGFLDELRTPYVDKQENHASWHWLTASRRGATLYWYAGDAADPVVGMSAWTIPIWARVAPDAAVAEFACGLEGRWHREVPVLDGDGATRTWIWISEEGGTILPFDPDEVIANYRSEEYIRVAATWTARSHRGCPARVLCVQATHPTQAAARRCGAPSVAGRREAHSRGGRWRPRSMT